jgi:hypothetical protein
MLSLNSPAVKWFASLVLVAVVGVAAPTVAAAAWTAPVTLSAAGATKYSPQVAVDVDGDAVFTWKRFDGTNNRIQARARSSTGTLSPIQNLSAAGQDAQNPQVAVDGAGNAVFTWSRFDGHDERIQARARTAAGALSPVQTLSAAEQNAYSPQVALDAAGNAVFIWHRSDGATHRIQARARSSTGTLSPVQTLSAAGQHASHPQVAVEDDGDAIFTWSRFDGTNSRIQARARSAGGTLSPVQTLSPAGQNTANAQVAVEDDGDASFTWALDDDTDPGLCCVRIQARARTAAGALSPVRTLSPAGQNAWDDPQVGVDADGDAVFTWSRFDGANYRIQARARSTTGALSPVQTLSAAGQTALHPQVAVDDAGDAVFTWQRLDGSNPRFRVQARTRSAAGVLGPTQTLSAAGRTALHPQIAVNDAGDADATWAFGRDDLDNPSFVIQAAAGP